MWTDYPPEKIEIEIDKDEFDIPTSRELRRNSAELDRLDAELRTRQWKAEDKARYCGFRSIEEYQRTVLNK